MKRDFRIITVVALLVALAATACGPQVSVSESATADATMTLSQAIQDGTVSATFSGTGASSFLFSGRVPNVKQSGIVASRVEKV